MKKNIYIIISVLIIVLILFLSMWLKKQYSTYESTSIADVVLVVGGDQMDIVCKVTNKDGTPVSNVNIDFRNNSGGNIGQTDRMGYVKVSVGETDLEEIVMNGITIFKRPYSYMFGYPTVKDGLKITITLKNP